METDCKRFVLTVTRKSKREGSEAQVIRLEFDDYSEAAEEAGDLWELSTVVQIELLDTVAKVNFAVI